MIIKCPTCDQPFVKEIAMKNHHKTEHGESLTMTKTECLECEKEFSHEECDERKYCSPECMVAHRTGVKMWWNNV